MSEICCEERGCANNVCYSVVRGDEQGNQWLVWRCSEHLKSDFARR